jgi:hypothetical protein
MKRTLFDPEEIGMEICPDCNSEGRRNGDVCSQCGGFGFVIKREEAPLGEGTGKEAGEEERQ